MMNKEAKKITLRDEKTLLQIGPVMIAQYQGLNVNELDACEKN